MLKKKIRVFEINKLDKCILSKMDKELIILEIKSLHSSFQNLEKYAFGYLSFLIGYVFNLPPKNLIEYVAIFTLLFILLFLIIFVEIKTRNAREYEYELYECIIRLKKGK